MKLANTPRKTLSFIAPVLSALLVAGCSEKEPSPTLKPEIKLSAEVLSRNGINDIFELDEIADLDWYLPNLASTDSAKKGIIIPFERKSGGTYITSFESRLFGDDSLGIAAVASYHWTQGTNYEESSIGAGVTMGTFKADNATKVGFDISVTSPKDNVYILVHGLCEAMNVTVNAIVTNTSLATPVECTDTKKYWTYIVNVENSSGENIHISIDATNNSDGLPKVGVGGVLVASKKPSFQDLQN